MCHASWWRAQQRTQPRQAAPCLRAAKHAGRSRESLRHRTPAQFTASRVEQPVVRTVRQRRLVEQSAQRGLASIFITMDRQVREGWHEATLRLYPPGVVGMRPVLQANVEHAQQQCLRDPEGKEDLPEQAAVHALAFSGAGVEARKYPMPRMGRMRSSAP